MILTRHTLGPILGMVILALLAGTSCGALKNVKASISGTVYMDGRPVAGTVQLVDESGNIVANERTTMEGHYTIKNLNPGKYTLQYLNYSGVPYGGETEVVVRIGRFETVDIHLSSADRVLF